MRAAWAVIPVLMVSLLWVLSPTCESYGETLHRVYGRGTDSQLDVYVIHGRTPGPTLLILGGIQGDEPGGYLAADSYADISLKTGNLIVVPRANFLSILQNERGTHGDMNRKFAGGVRDSDEDREAIEVIKALMRESDYFLNLHDGSGFYSPVWESALRNPMRFGQSIISDAEEYVRTDGQAIRMAETVNRVLARVNRQIPLADHRFQFNNHMTLSPETKHREQRLSATYHALTQVGIPAFGIETSKDISGYRLRARYQTLVINAFLEEFGIVPESPKIDLESPSLRYLVVSINGRTPIVVKPSEVLRANQGDTVRITQIEANYPRGLSARIKRKPGRLNDLNHDVAVTADTSIEVRKDRFLMANVPVQVRQARSTTNGGQDFQPRVRFFCVRVNDRPFVVEPGESLTVMRGDTLTILDPQTNLHPEDARLVKIDLRGFQAEASPDPVDDRGHLIGTATDLQEKYGTVQEGSTSFPLQAKFNKQVFAECSIVVAEPKLEYVVLKSSGGPAFVAYAGDTLELPEPDVLRIMDLKTNAVGTAPLAITMAGRSVPWQQSGSAGVDSSKLSSEDMPLDVTRHGRSIGRIWLRQGDKLRILGRDNPLSSIRKVLY